MQSFISSLLNGEYDKRRDEELLNFHGIKLGDRIGLILSKNPGSNN